MKQVFQIPELHEVPVAGSKSPKEAHTVLLPLQSFA
jgi:hypothetical protein